MCKQWLKYLLVILLLTSYLNRGLFVSAPETEICDISATAKGEINSLFEFLQKVITDHENGIDEDGNSPESYNFAKVAHPLIDHSLSNTFELKYPVIIVRKTQIQFNEAITSLSVYGTIDHPPEKA